MSRKRKLTESRLIAAREAFPQVGRRNIRSRWRFGNAGNLSQTVQSLNKWPAACRCCVACRIAPLVFLCRSSILHLRCFEDVTFWLFCVWNKQRCLISLVVVTALTQVSLSAGLLRKEPGMYALCVWIYIYFHHPYLHESMHASSAHVHNGSS